MTFKTMAVLLLMSLPARDATEPNDDPALFQMGKRSQDVKQPTISVNADITASRGSTQKNFTGNPVVCPGIYVGTPKLTYEIVPSMEEYNMALQKLDVEAVKRDVAELLTNSQRCWPADFGNYGPFFVRLAWHCSGTFRNTDGVGGCGGGRQRFDPEASWGDNTNLDKARALLVPIKEKYGIGLSWGDLFTIAGTEGLRQMKTPIKNFCWGRVDDPNGYLSEPLGPSDMQAQTAPCTGPVNGECQRYPNLTALATTTLGDIYVNPEGPMGVPDPAKSAEEIRITFCKMGNPGPDGKCNEKKLVALIGGGHAFGKSHGACSDKDYLHPSGFPPNEALRLGVAPWMGQCPPNKMMGTTFTSGFEGPWTNTPTTWTNQYFTDLLDKEWEVWMGPGGHWQWRIKGTCMGPNCPKNTTRSPLLRLTSDIALIHDTAFKKIVEEFAANMSALEDSFDSAWFDLTTNGGTWAPGSFCENGAKAPTPSPRMLKTDVTFNQSFQS